MAALVEAAEALAEEVAREHGLGVGIDYHDIFHHCENAPAAVAHLRRALDAEEVRHRQGPPLRASEDFGRFGDAAPAALFFPGAGEKYTSLHNPDYDFPHAQIGRPSCRASMVQVG